MKKKLMYAFFPLNWIFESPNECEHEDIRKKLTLVYVERVPKGRVKFKTDANGKKVVVKNGQVIGAQG